LFGFVLVTITYEKIGGIILSTWWIALFFTAWLICFYGKVTVILGIPIFILGILLLLYSFQRIKRVRLKVST